MLQRLVVGARRRFSWTAVAVVGTLLVALAFYVWTSAPSAANPPGPYHLLAKAFAHGRFDLPLHVPPQLAGLENPYDPLQNGPYVTGLHDLSYYHGRLYASWGPAPVLLLYLPARLLGWDVSDRVATIIFCLAAALASVALLRLLMRRLLPGTPAWMFVVGAILLSFGNLAPYELRSSEVYDLAVVSGMALVALGLLLLLSAALGTRARSWQLAGGGLSLGLAVMARPQLGLTAIFLVGVLVVLLRREPVRAKRVGICVLTLAPFVACLVAMAVYDHARFGSITETGQHYQLADADNSHLSLFTPGYLLPGLWYYLLAPARLSAQFPFLWLAPPPSYPGHTPAAYTHLDQVLAVFPDVPLVGMLIAAPWAMRKGPPALRRITAGLVVAAAGIVVFLAGALPAIATRYEVDFILLVLIAALLAWFSLVHAARGRVRQVVAVAGLVAALYTVLLGAAASLIGRNNSLAARRTATYDRLERFFSPLPVVASQIAGHPLVAGIDRLARTDADIGEGPVMLELISPGNEPAIVRFTLKPGPSVPLGKPLRAWLSGTNTQRWALDVDGGVKQLPVRLTRGINRLMLQVTATPAQTPSAGPLARIEQLAVAR